MNKDTIKAFLLWLESASDAELVTRRKEIFDVLKRVGTREARADVNLALRLLDEEQVARLELSRARQR